MKLLETALNSFKNCLKFTLKLSEIFLKIEENGLQNCVNFSAYLRDTNTQEVDLFNSLSQNYQLNAKVFSRIYPSCTNTEERVTFLSLSQDYLPNVKVLSRIYQYSRSDSFFSLSHNYRCNAKVLSRIYSRGINTKKRFSF